MSEKFINREYLLDSFKDYNTDIVEKKFDQVNSNLVEQKMLGWTVPKECPIQNEVSGNQFIQKVGRVDLGSLDWKAYSSDRFITYNIKNAKPFDDSIKANAFCKIYKTVSKNNVEFLNMSIGIDDSKNVWLRNDSYKDAAELKNSLQGVYLYYELETPITKTIDGNEAVTKLKNDLNKPYTLAELGFSNGIQIGNQLGNTYRSTGQTTNIKADFKKVSVQSHNFNYDVVATETNSSGNLLITLISKSGSTYTASANDVVSFTFSS